MKLIDCPYYTEVHLNDRDGGHTGNCWDSDSWYDERDSCAVPGCSWPLCDYEKNGWKSEKFIARVDEEKLKNKIGGQIEKIQKG